jgi:hypothetical protein
VKKIAWNAANFLIENFSKDERSLLNLGYIYQLYCKIYKKKLEEFSITSPGSEPSNQDFISILLNSTGILA